jgi:hypothetical protein
MIEVIITGKSDGGQFPYRIDGIGEAHSGSSDAPLLDACRWLKRMAKAPDQEYAHLKREDRDGWDARCTVGWGASHAIKSTGGFKPT